MDYLSVEEARDQPGLRLVLTAGVPGPWGEALKAILAFKGVDYLPVRQEAGAANDALRDWTGQTSAPVLVPEEGPPVCHWLDQLHYVERIAPAPALLPADAADRATAIGLSALIAGADGFGWQRRLMLLAPGMALADPPEPIARMAAKYGWSSEAAGRAESVISDICAHLDARLASGEAAGHDYFLGDSPGAVDLYWANFAGMVAPLPPRDNPMPDWIRGSYASGSDSFKACLTPRLLAHRDRMYARHLSLPLEF